MKKEIQSADDLHIKITKSNGEVILDECGCTLLSYVLNCRGELLRTFLGAHNPEIIKILNKVQRDYMKEVEKALKEQEKKDKDIKVKKQKKSKDKNVNLNNVDLSKAQDQIDKMSEEYGVDVEKILNEQIEKFKTLKAEKDAKGVSMDDLNPTPEESNKTSKKVDTLLKKRNIK